MTDVSIIISTNASEASKEIGGLSASLVKSAAKANQMAKAFAFLDKSFNKGKIDADQYSSSIIALNKEEARLYSAVGKTTTAVNNQSVALSNSAATASKAAVAAGILANKQRMAGKSTNKFGMYSQQVGYQVGDFAVQVQSGTNALVAFGQQGTQLAGLLPGLAGAVLGIGIAIGTAVARSVLDAKNLEIDFKAVINELKKPLESIKPIVEAISSVFKSTGGAVVSVLTTIANNLDRVVLYVTVAATAFGVKLVAGLVAARLATFTLAGAFAFLRTAIIKTGIGALIIIVAEAIRMFFLLKEQLGGVGPLLDLLKRAFVDVLDKIANRFSYLGAKIALSWQTMKHDALMALSGILSSVNSDFVNKFIGTFAGAIAGAAEYIKTLPKVFVAVFEQVKLAVANGVNSFTGLIGTGINNLLKKFGADTYDFGDVINTENMGGGDIGAVLRDGAANIAAAYDKAANTDYVVAGQNLLNDAIISTLDSQLASANAMANLDADYATQGTALAELSAAYDALGKASDIDFGNMLRTKTDDDDGGSKSSKSSSEDPIAKLKREIALNKELLYVSKEKAAVLTQVRDIQKQLADDGKTYDAKKLVALVMQNNELKKQRELFLENQTKMEDLSQSIANSMGDALMGIVDGTMTVKDAFRSMARDIIKQLYQVLVVQRLVGSAEAGKESGIAGFIIKGLSSLQADGGAWHGGSQIKAYANGGVVGGPTTFPMAGGKTGLMGEAGPEAIMPLKRGANGKLGVQMEGGGGDTINVVQNFSFQANGDDTVKRLIAQAAPKIAQMTKSSLLDDRRRGGSTKAAFG